MSMQDSINIEDWEQFLKEIEDDSISGEFLMKEQKGAISTFQKIEIQLQKELHESLDTSLPSGFVIGKFVVVKEIGKGGMSSVYLAKRDDGLFDQQVAIKLLSPDLLGDKHQSYFDTERKILAKLNHPNISKILDGGITSSGIPYLVMEYVEGISLEQYLDEHTPSLNDRIAIFKKICEAVRHAHGQLILHRDLKPSNVFIDKNGSIKLLDFGIGGFIDETDTGYNEGGTLRYLPPEYFTHKEYGVQSDIYQLGLLGFRILEGQHAVEGDDADQVIQNIKEGNISEWNQLKSYPALKAILYKCFQKDTEGRYTTVDALIIDLESYQQDKPIKALPANWRYNGLLFLKRNKLSATFTFLLFFLAIAFAIWTNIQANQIEKEKQRALAANAFLTNIFKANDPDITKGEEVTALALLENAENQLKYLDDSEVKADMLRKLGELYESLGEYEQSINYLKDAISLYQENKIIDKGYVKSLIMLGSAYINMRYINEADSVLSIGLETIDDDRTNTLLLTELLYFYATAMNGKNDFAKGDSAISLALELTKTLNANNFSSEMSEHESIAVHEAMLYTMKSQIEVNQSNLEEALEAAQKAQSIVENNEVRSFSNKIYPSYYLAIAYNAMGDYEKENNIYEDIVEKNTENFGLEHPTTWNSMRLLATSYNIVENYKASDSLYTFLLPKYISFYGDLNPNTLELIFYIARSQMHQKNYKKAKERFLQLLEADIQVSGPEDIVIADDCEQLGIIETTLGNYDSAESYFERCEKIYGKYVDRKNIRFVTLYHNFGNLYRDSGEYQKAITYYDQSLKITKEIYGESHERYQKTLKQKTIVEEMMNASI